MSALGQEATLTALSSAESRIEKLERGKHLRGHEGWILMTGTWQNREGGFRPLLQEFVVEPDRFDYGNAGVGIAIGDQNWG